MKSVLIIVLVLSTVSCNNINQVPQGIIKPRQMQDIFWDMIRSDVLAQEIIRKDSTQNLKGTGFTFTEKIFAIHKTDRVQFEKSLSYYEKHPVLIKTVFDSLYAIHSRRNSLDPGRKGPPVRDHNILRGKKIP